MINLSKISKKAHVIVFATVIGIYAIHVMAAIVEEQPIPKVPITCFLVENASIFIKRLDEPPYGRANVGHQIGAGARTVLAIRAWEDLTSSDSSQLWKATLEFAPLNADMPLGKVEHVPVSRSYFTYGGLFWLTGGGYVWGENTIRQVDFVRTKTGFEARINGTIAATAASRGVPTRTTVAWRCDVIRRTVTEIDLWEGKPGTTFESFHPANTQRPVDHL